ncbi:MAG TPA: D-alanine--D-alanine ligase family protein, partial [Candidatus Binatia bacterium]|nr:D-alanine--D-alanine ligase family protein [Candidatus Binatia bacterium]
VLPIAIDRSGCWLLDRGARLLRNAAIPRVERADPAEKIAVIPGGRSAALVRAASGRSIGRVDVFFPVLHGPFGEDGTIQGLLKVADVPFVGAGVLGSALGMDKDVMKRLLRDAGIAVAKFRVFERHEHKTIRFAAVARELGLPLFVKPASLGSSVGISKVRSPSEFAGAIALAFRYENKLIVEEAIRGREIECSVLGNEKPLASLPGEIIVQREFYSYQAKYLDDQGARLEIPARLPRSLVKRIQRTALQAFRALCCEGMARVDFFLQDDGRVVVNEINTIPGFTQISMYPKMWEATGLSSSRLIDRLIGLALSKGRTETRLGRGK